MSSDRSGHDRRPQASNGRGRQFVKFTFFKVDTAFRRLAPDKQRIAKLEMLSAIRSFNRRMLLRSYSLVGLRADTDFMLWQVAATPEPFQELMTAILNTAMAPYLEVTTSFLAVTRRSIYDIGEMVGGDGNAEADRIVIQPGEHDYLFVYPFVKTRPWYALSMEARQEMINEHIRIGRKYPQIKLNTTYSYGIDDQEFVVAFEGDNPMDFVDLVMELRESAASMYTLRDTPMFTCRNLPLAETLDSIGGAPIAADAAVEGPDADGWLDVAPVDALGEGESSVVYFAGKQVALFNAGGQIFALSNRCSHARGPLSEGTLIDDEDGCSVICPWHYAKFDLDSGIALEGAASTAVPTYEVMIREDTIYLREKHASEETATR
jgi:chlorite dismutase